MRDHPGVAPDDEVGVTRDGHRLGRRERTWPADGPRPGDPASDGPRPPARWRDGLWLAFAGAVALVTVLQTIRLVVTVLTDERVQVTGGGAVLGFIITVAWYLTIYWLAAGAWRRSVWGCPFEHREDAPYDRRCQRHPLLAAAPTPDAAAVADDGRHRS